MQPLNIIDRTAPARILAAATLAALFLAPTAQAAVPGIQGPTFSLVANEGHISQPDGASVYAWGFGCADAGAGETFLPANWNGVKPTCPVFQIPAPTLIVTEGDTVTVNLTNNLPAAAGSTSIVFPGQIVTATAAAPHQGLLALEAAKGETVTYTFTAGKPGTFSFHSGTQVELQVEMGMYGALIVLPKGNQATSTSAAANGCHALGSLRSGTGTDYRLAVAAYDHPQTCYDREYIVQLTAMDSRIHDAAEQQVLACAAAIAASTTPVACPALQVATEPYRANYFLVNGRSFPDDIDAPYSGNWPSQPYNLNPLMHPGEHMLIRAIGQGRMQHPFHIHGDHARTLARDGELLLAATDTTPQQAVTATGTASVNRLAGPLLFTVPTVPGQTTDLIFSWSGKGLNWDVYNHKAADNVICMPDADGYYTAASGAALTAPNYGEFCADHNKAIPVTPPDPQVVANGQWYGGSPYLGLQATNAGAFQSTPLPPGIAEQNGQAGYAYMWHSHDEREITTNDVFPGGMMTMMVVEPPVATIDEAN
jgi:FtsP/CotA-like multicopper oxidase with cupredoxin domain